MHVTFAYRFGIHSPNLTRLAMLFPQVIIGVFYADNIFIYSE